MIINDPMKTSERAEDMEIGETVLPMEIGMTGGIVLPMEIGETVPPMEIETTGETVLPMVIEAIEATVLPMEIETTVLPEIGVIVLLEIGAVFVPVLRVAPVKGEVVPGQVHPAQEAEGEAEGETGRQDPFRRDPRRPIRTARTVDAPASPGPDHRQRRGRPHGHRRGWQRLQRCQQQLEHHLDGSAA